MHWFTIQPKVVTWHYARSLEYLKVSSERVVLIGKMKWVPTLYLAHPVPVSLNCFCSIRTTTMCEVI